MLMITANANFGTGNRKDKPALRRLTERLRRRSARTTATHAPPQILFLQEAKTGRMARLLGRLWRGLQGKGPARSGTALLARGVRLRRLGLWLGGDSAATLPRWVTRGSLPLLTGKRLVLMSVHIFPPRSGKAAQDRYVRRLARRLRRIERRGHEWVVGADANMDMDIFARHLGGIAHHHGCIEGFVTSRGVRVVAAGTDRTGLRMGAFDHPSRWIEVEGIRAA